jgi:hypothetical protein
VGVIGGSSGNMRPTSSSNDGVQDDEVVQAFPSYGSDQALGISILPGTLRGREHLRNAHRLQTPPYLIPINGIPIPDQIMRSFTIGESLDNLLCNPSCGWVFGHVEVEHLAPAVFQHQEYEQDPQPDCRNNKEVNRYDVSKVIREKPSSTSEKVAVEQSAESVIRFAPICLGPASSARHEFSELATGDWRGPFAGSVCGFRSQRSVLLGEDLSVLRAEPRICESVLVASAPPHRIRLSEDQRVTPIAPNLRQTNPEQPIQLRQHRPFAFPLVSG